MKKIILCVCILLLGCDGDNSKETIISEEDLGKVTDVWGCHKGGYGNNNILCNVETTKQKIPNVNVSILKVPYIGIGDTITVRITQRSNSKREYLCITNTCSLYYVQGLY